MDEGDAFMVWLSCCQCSFLVDVLRLTARTWSWPPAFRHVLLGFRAPAAALTAEEGDHPELVGGLELLKSCLKAI